MRAALLTGAFTLAACVAFAQAPAASPSPAPDLVVARQQIAKEFVEAALQSIQHNVPGGHHFGNQVSGFQERTLSYLLTFHTEKAVYKKLLDAMNARSDKQAGASPKGSGTTALATKGAVAQILALAVEQGAFEKDVSGTTLTLRAKPAGFIKFLQGQGVLDIYHDYKRSAGARFAARFSAAASFDTSRGAAAGSFSASADQFSGWSARAELVNGRDAALTQYADRWRHLLDDGTFREAAGKLDDALDGWPAFVDWRTRLADEVVKNVDEPFMQNGDKAAAVAAFAKILEQRLPELEKLAPLPVDVELRLDVYVQQLSALVAGIGDVYAFVNKGTLLTVEFGATRDAKLPDLYTATAVFEAALGAERKTDLTLNGEVSYYKAVPDGASRKLKNLAFVAELDHPLGSVLGLRDTTFTLAARYSYLPKDTVAAGAAAPKGNIAVVQAKLTVPVKSGVKVPLSLSWANRTESIKESFVRANFGITVDLDTLLAAAKAGK